MPAAVAVEDLSKRFGRTRALDRVSVQIDAGAAVAVLGPNGAGKTTFLRLCATLLRPSSGRLELLGIDAAERGAAVRRRIGFVGHESLLYPDLSPSENLTFYARLFGLADAHERVPAFLEQMGLVGWSHRPVRTLSRGQLQRCALARALLHEPELLILDEPYTGLDFAAADRLQALLENTHQRGTTLLMSTHDLGRGLALCSTALVLTAGRLVFHGSCGGQTRFEAEYRRLAGAGVGSP
jgi:heme exporter protein A